MSAYTVYVTPPAWRELTALPGHMRQRVRRAVSALASDPRPPESKALGAPALPDSEHHGSGEAPDRELRRIRIDRWRVVYAVTEDDLAVDVLAIRKRPPYDYGDLERLLAQR